LPISVGDAEGILDAIASHDIDLTVIGPEAPLADGLADRIVEVGRKVFGPTQAAAQIEASKSFAKDLMARANVPTAACRAFTDEGQALRYIDGHAEPLVVKASGLAAGKGAIVCSSREEAGVAAREMFAGRFGEAGSTVLIEEFLEGEELSVLALTDGEHMLVLPSSQDHKRLKDGDLGPNTGGMGAYAPVSIATPELLDKIEQRVLEPTIQAMAEQGAPYTGVLYAGLMISPEGDPSVVEFNCRFGDPEAQAVLPVANIPLLDHLWSIAARESWAPERSRVEASQAAVTTVLAAAGYPEAPQKGAAISVPEELPPDTILFHAGTKLEHGATTVSGGRVLCATGTGPTVTEAAQASRRLAEVVEFDGRFFRRDIGWREVARAGVA
jgi:phosphoribosylamine--glycine ligase